MRIEQIRHFLEVSKCNSLSQAAENLLIGKSTLSNSIHALEDELRHPLFVRTTKGTFLTPFGESIVSYANDILLSTDKIYTAQKNTYFSNKNALHVHSYPAGCVSAILELFIYIKEQFPETNVFVSETKSESILQELIASGRHLGVNSAGPLSYHYIKMNAENHEYICERVYEDFIFVYVNKDHPWHEMTTIDIHQLENEPLAISKLFLASTDNSFYHDYNCLQKRYATDNYELLKSLVLRNKMIAIAPSLVFYNWKNLYLGKDIIQIPLTGCSTKLINFLIYKNTSFLNPVEIAALDFLRQFYNNLT